MCDTFNHMFWVIILRLTGCRPGINTNVKLLLLIFFASCSRQVMWLCMILIWRSAFFASYSRCSALNYWTTSSSCNPLALFLLLLLLLLHLLICSFILFSAKISIMLMLLNQIPQKKGTILYHLNAPVTLSVQTAYITIYHTLHVLSGAPTCYRTSMTRRVTRGNDHAFVVFV